MVVNQQAEFSHMCVSVFGYARAGWWVGVVVFGCVCGYWACINTC